MNLSSEMNHSVWAVPYEESYPSPPVSSDEEPLPWGAYEQQAHGGGKLRHAHAARLIHRSNIAAVPDYARMSSPRRSVSGSAGGVLVPSSSSPLYEGGFVSDAEPSSELELIYPGGAYSSEQEPYCSSPPSYQLSSSCSSPVPSSSLEAGLPYQLSPGELPPYASQEGAAYYPSHPEDPAAYQALSYAVTPTHVSSPSRVRSTRPDLGLLFSLFDVLGPHQQPPPLSPALMVAQAPYLKPLPSATMVGSTSPASSSPSTSPAPSPSSQPATASSPAGSASPSLRSPPPYVPDLSPMLSHVPSMSNLSFPREWADFEDAKPLRA